MILNKIFEVFGDAFLLLINVFNIPGIPDDVLEGAREFLHTLFSNASLLGLFIKINTIKSTAVLLIIILNFRHIYNLGIWLMDKVTFWKK